KDWLLNIALCFNVDPVAWKSWSTTAAGFVMSHCSEDRNIHICTKHLYYLNITYVLTYLLNVFDSVPNFAVNMSLGLTMIADPTTQNTMVCGPTIPKDCRSITMYNGVCFQIDRSNRLGPPVPSSLQECRTEADIAFLLDGSGSVSSQDFQTMKTFVKNLVRSFVGKGTQFAVAQYSSSPHIHYYFDDFFKSGNWKSNIDYINQMREGNLHSSRSNVKRILIVITDGASHDRAELPHVARLAERENIVRFAIGVGAAFNDVGARGELATIASYPSKNHVFQVQSFDALDAIRQNLQDKIFSIEGSQSSGESLKMEMAQEGFSAAYIPGGVQTAIVGANQWKGGYLKYTSRGQKQSSYEPTSMEPDSYLGYSMAVGKTKEGTLTIVGAPRYQHRGIVMGVQENERSQTIDPHPWQSQTGEYFGAEVCAMDVDRDSYTDLILISAPMYTDTDREGRVYVCSLVRLNVECHFESPVVLRGDVSDRGRFGSSLAVLPDLNADGLSDLAVGAPLENDGQGSIYIFLGEGGRTVRSTYSQRIPASEVKSGLKFFGISISQSSFDQSVDSLPDLVVGSKGTVVLLRSKPIVMVEVTVSYSPKQIPSQNDDCTKPLENTAEICFTMSRVSTVNTARATIRYNFTLDATRKVPNNRAYITDKQREKTESLAINLGQRQCSRVKFFIDACPEDALNSLSNELRFTFDGVLSDTNLKPSLAQDAKTTIGFEINCGTDNKCVDNLKVDFNFTSSSVVKVGIDELLDVTVSVENREENSYNSRVILTYPAELSYRKFTSLQGRIECNSVDSEDGLSRGKTECTIDKPIFKNRAFFTVSYGIETNSQLERRIFVTANATSGNQYQSPSSELYKKEWIDVKYSIFVTFESTLSYTNFTFGKNNLQKPIQQTIVVTNDIRALNFTVVIKVPVKLGDKDIWVDSNSLQIPDCQRDRDEEPNVTDFVAQIQKNTVVDCSVAKCRVFKCTRFMGRSERKNYIISANLSSGWIEQIGLKSAKFLLTSTASLEYDSNQFIFFSTGSNNNPPIRKIEAEIEVYSEPDFTKEIVGGTLGGLVLLAALTAGLYKAGFFKSKYKEMINEGAEGADPQADGAATSPEA
uniref:VWFA domain-containing protein n=1 Tax=Lates calcarifer TaxID=8187 RepID=A0A4W6G6B3_LATCA